LAGLNQHLLASELEHGRLAYRRDCPRCRPRRRGEPTNSPALAPAGVAALVTAATLIPTASAGAAVASHSHPVMRASGANGLIRSVVRTRLAEDMLPPPPAQCDPDDPTCGPSAPPVEACSDPSCGEPPADAGPTDSSPATTTPTDGTTAPPDPASTTYPTDTTPAPAPPTDTPPAPTPATSTPTDTTSAPTDTPPAATTPAVTAPPSSTSVTPAPAPAAAPATPAVTAPQPATVTHSLDRIGVASRLRAVERSTKGPSAPEPSANRGAVSSEPRTSQSDSAPTPATTTQTPALNDAASQPSATETTQRGAVGDSKTYVVRAGDSLWLIAKRMLPPNASNAEIARMVNQLWTMNASRIRTGNPNLLGVGVVLALP
jgi:hypothetical protein